MRGFCQHGLNKWACNHCDVRVDLSTDDDAVQFQDTEYDSLMKGLEDVEANRCHICKKPFVPAQDCTNYITGKWDGHTYKAACDHYPSFLRVSIG